MALCSRCTYPSIHFFVSRSRSVVWQAHIQAFTLKLPQDHGRLSGAWVVCVHVVLRVVLVVCVLFCCGGACVWCLVKLGTLSLSLALSPSSSASKFSVACAAAVVSDDYCHILFRHCWKVWTKRQTKYQPKVLLKISSRRGLWLRRWRFDVFDTLTLSFLLDENILGKWFCSSSS